MPRFSKKPLDQQTDQMLVNRYWGIFNDCCKRYGVSSFDWPTFRVLYPDEYDQMQAVVAEGKKRIAATGMFNNIPHDKQTFKPVTEVANAQRR